MDDLQTFSDLIKLTSDGVKTATNAVGLVERLKSTLAKSKAPSDPELRALIAELSEEVVNAKLANVDLKATLLEMKESAIEADAKNSEFDRYELWETPAGKLVYRLKEEKQGSEPMHHICPNCYVKGSKSILQGGKSYLRCHSCETSFEYQKDRHLDPGLMGSDWMTR